jgi:quinol-cytochrome oxidoreductase complex cytochrome b subunit
MAMMTKLPGMFAALALVHQSAAAQPAAPRKPNIVLPGWILRRLWRRWPRGRARAQGVRR